jgi:hypothetical protein
MELNFLSGITISRLGHNFRKDKSFIDSLYIHESYPIFEHSIYHILSYLGFENKLFALSGRFGKAVLCVGLNNEIFLFTPVIYKFDHFIKLINKINAHYNRQSIRIQNVSENWMHKNINSTNRDFFNTIQRSKAEAIYNVNLLNDLPGKHFAKLRQAKNRLLNTGVLKFESVSQKNIGGVITLLKAWQKYQGFKYSKNKYEKEKFALTYLAKLSKNKRDIFFEVGNVNGKLVSFFVMFKSNLKPNWGTIYELKGLNRAIDGGVHGATDATYYHVFQKAKSMGIDFLNDGELGIEEGTKNHKLRFKPVIFLKSFDLLFNKAKQ